MDPWKYKILGLNDVMHTRTIIQQKHEDFFCLDINTCLLYGYYPLASRTEASPCRTLGGWEGRCFLTALLNSELHQRLFSWKPSQSLWTGLMLWFLAILDGTEMQLDIKERHKPAECLHKHV